MVARLSLRILQKSRICIDLWGGLRPFAPHVMASRVDVETRGSLGKARYGFSREDCIPSAQEHLMKPLLTDLLPVWRREMYVQLLRLRLPFLIERPVMEAPASRHGAARGGKLKMHSHVSLSG